MKALSLILPPTEPQPWEGMISCIQTISGDCSLISLWLILTLVAMRWLDTKWHKVVEKKLTELKEDEPYGEIIVHGGNDINEDEAYSAARREWMKQVTKVVFLLNITEVGDYACFKASNLVAVDIPEGITIIGRASFAGCIRLKDFKFPNSLTSIGSYSFQGCSSLEQVYLLHTNVLELGQSAFQRCESLREMKVPDSLQKFGTCSYVFWRCSKLVPADIKNLRHRGGSRLPPLYTIINCNEIVFIKHKKENPFAKNHN